MIKKQRLNPGTAIYAVEGWMVGMPMRDRRFMLLCSIVFQSDGHAHVTLLHCDGSLINTVWYPNSTFAPGWGIIE